MLDKNKLSRDFEKNPIKKGEPICKEDLTYLRMELNLTNKEIAAILGCPTCKIDHFSFKHGLKKTKEQKAQIMQNTTKNRWKRLSEEQKETIRAKQKAWWNNRTKEEKEQWKITVSNNSKIMWKNMTQEQYDSTISKMSQSAKLYNENMSEEQKQNRIKAFQNTWYNATQEEKCIRNKKNRDKKKQWWENVSEEVLENRSKHWKQTMSNKTREELQEIQNKIYQTKKKNNSLNSSKPEKYYEYLLREKFKEDLLTQYKSEKYPFACDFYLKHKNIYIDLNFHWTHGKHLFDINNEQDQQLLMLWKQKAQKSKFYKNAIYTWTDLDVRKDKISKENNINRLVFYTEAEFNNWLEEN